MCGIAGVIHYEESALDKLMLTLKHRGPDAQTYFKDDQVALIHTRLAIQDLMHGIQPLHYQDFTIIFNGEIYNHLALRAYLTEFEFRTQSDTETLLYLFIKYQFSMLDWLDGMFAFCIYDKKQQTIYLARDRAGKKPLYYYQDGKSFAFASELNALKQIKSLTIAPDAIHSYLRAGLIWKPHTPYNNVLELEAGCALSIDIRTLSLKVNQYFNMLDHYQKPISSSISFKEALLQVENKLKQSIADRIAASDVEVGVFLSGGIDSNLIAALGSQIKPGIKTFTVKFSGAYDESNLAQLTAKQYQTEHIALSLSTHLKEDIENILLAYGEPFMDSSAIPSYYVSKEARKYVKVVLGGDGADELFAGYRRYVPIANGLLKYAQHFSPLLNFLPGPNNKQSLYNYLYRLIAMANKKGLDFYLSATSDVFEDTYPIKDSTITQQLSEFVQNTWSNASLSPLKKMLYTDFSVLLFGDLLVKMDIASMANSLEVRSPFLSKYLLEFVPTLPDEYKIKFTKTKYILRQLAKKYLSPTLINQPKRGFEVPLKQWIDDTLKENIFDRLQPGCYAGEYVKPTFIQSILANKVAVSAEKRAKMIWSLYCLEVWYQHEAKNSIHC